MAYGQKYFAELIAKGVTRRMEIHQDGFTGTATRIGSLQALSVGFTGNEPIEAPIVKSELNFTLADAWKTSVPGYKHGQWEEFYTSDAFRYKVVLKEAGSVIWTGFLTPDSYSEDLIYGGSVSFIARDMLGHMGDFDFDASGDLLRVGDIIEAGLEKAGVAMTLTSSACANLKGAADSGSTAFGCLDWLVCREVFDGGTWYDAVHDICEALGLTLRWDGQGGVTLTPLRYLVEGRTAKAATFVTAARRSMDPAVRRIVDTLKYDSDGVIWKWSASPSYFTAKTLTIQGKTVNTFEPSSSSPWSRTGNVGMFDTTSLGSKDGATDLMLSVVAKMWPVAKVRVDSLAPARISRIQELSGSAIPITLSMRVRSSIWIDMGTSGHDLVHKSCSMTLVWSFRAYAGSSMEMWWDNTSGQWVSAQAFNQTYCEFFSDADEPYIDLQAAMLPTPEGAQYVEIRLHGFRWGSNLALVYIPEGEMDISNILENYPAYGLVQDIRIEQSNAGDFDQFVTTTVYNEKNNVIYTREPKLGQVPQMASPFIIGNGVYSPASPYRALQVFRFGTSGEWMPLAGLVAKQLLCFYDHPNNDINGTLIDQAADRPGFHNRWTWNDTDHLLIGGKLNAVTGRIDSCVLREYVTWASLWSTSGVSPSSASVAYNGGTVTISVTAPAGQGWAVEGLPSWISASRSSGTGSGTVTLTVSSNLVYQAREATVIIAGFNVTVSQAARPTGTPTWDAEDTEIDYAAQDVMGISIAENGKATTVSTSVTWLHAEQLAGGLLITADENTGTASRSGRITLSWSGGSTYVTVTQGGMPQIAPTWDAHDAIVDRLGQDVQEITVTPNGHTVTVTSSQTWCTVSKSGNVYTISVTANAARASRSATVTMSWNGQSLSVSIVQAGTDQSEPMWNARTVSVSSTAQVAEQIIVMTSGFTVQVVSDQSWCTITQSNGIYTVNVAQNSSVDSRIAKVTLSWSGGSDSVYITQKGVEDKSPTWDAQGLTIGPAAQTVERITVLERGLTATLSSTVSWLHVSGSGENYTVTADDNLTADTRTGVIRMSWTGGSETVTIRQMGRVITVPTWEARDADISEDAQDVQNILVKPNGNTVTVTSNASWLTVTAETGGIYKVHAAENTTEVSRAARITMSWSGGSRFITVTQAAAAPTYYTVTLRSTDPAGATVTIDGQAVQVGGFVIVRGGVVTIIASKTGYIDHVEQRTITADTVLDLELEPARSTWPVSLSTWRCTASNLATETDRNRPYVNTVTPSPGYVISGAVVIQMGGVTLEDAWTLNADGTVSIYIDSVTASLSISVVAA